MFLPIEYLRQGELAVERQGGILSKIKSVISL